MRHVTDPLGGTVKNKAIVGVVLLLIVGGVASSQSAPSDQEASHKTQARGFWMDPATGLMWAAKDNGKDVSWKNAIKYCRDLRLAGYSDWRLATLSELEEIYDKTANAPGLARMGGPAKGSPFTWHVKGNLFLTGNQWSSNQILDDRGHPSGYVSYFDFNEGRPSDDPTGFPYPFANRRALCVRGSGK
jgi:Protein of unknown function (DUF1566)